jgi:transcriptional regulator with GAF, ATPase, and Fis domain
VPVRVVPTNWWSLQLMATHALFLDEIELPLNPTRLLRVLQEGRSPCRLRCGLKVNVRVIAATLRPKNPVELVSSRERTTACVIALKLPPLP